MVEKGKYEEVCVNCNNKFTRRIGQHPKYKVKSSHANWSGNHYCGKQCFYDYLNQQQELNCGYCHNKIIKSRSQINKSKSGLMFCNSSCAASYNNTLKRKSRRSKVEDLLFQLIVEHYPDLEIIPNDKRLLDGYEVDIAIPELSLCIEWNGVVHYQPIYGKEKLNKIQKRDKEKVQIAKDNNIQLIVVKDLTSTQEYVHQKFEEILPVIDKARLV